MAAGSIEAEINKYSEQVATDPKSRAFVPLADAYRRLGRYDEAITVATEGVKHNPHYVAGKIALARAHFENGEPEPASALLEGVVRVAPDNILANRILAEIYLQLSDSAKAGPLLKRLVSIDPSDQRAAEQLAQLTSPAPMAVPSAVSPPSPVMTPTLAEMYRSQGHPDKAAEVYRALGDDKKVSDIKVLPGSSKHAALEGWLLKIRERRRKVA